MRGNPSASPVSTKQPLPAAAESETAGSSGRRSDREVVELIFSSSEPGLGLCLELDSGSGNQLSTPYRIAADDVLQVFGSLVERTPPPGFRLVDLNVIDLIEAPSSMHRFEVVYQLDLPGRNFRVSIHATLEGSEPELDSVSAIWPSALALEREAFDLFGIRFRGHPDLRRILLAADFEGAPLRKTLDRRGQAVTPSGSAS